MNKSKIKAHVAAARACLSAMLTLLDAVEACGRHGLNEHGRHTLASELTSVSWIVSSELNKLQDELQRKTETPADAEATDT